MGNDVRFYKTLWGMTGTLREQVERVAQAGYDGIEAYIPEEQVEEFAPLLREFNLRYVSMHFVVDPAQMEPEMERASRLRADRANLHAGRDYWGLDESCRFFEDVLEVADTCPFPVCIETHRGRLLFTPSSTAEFLRRFPTLNLTADFSHWVNVCESMLDDQKEAVDLAIERARHLHARVGHPEGPQVADPAASEWLPYTEKFELWWDAIVAAHRRRGETLTVDCELGPPPYQNTDPRTGEPLVDVWESTLWLTQRLRKRFLG